MPTDNWYLRVKLHGLDLDLQSLTISNHNGRNNRHIAELEKVRADVRKSLAARPGERAVVPLRVSLFEGETTVVAIVQDQREASALFARWAMRRPGSGAIMRKAEPHEYATK